MWKRRTPTWVFSLPDRLVLSFFPSFFSCQNGKCSWKHQSLFWDRGVPRQQIGKSLVERNLRLPWRLELLEVRVGTSKNELRSASIELNDKRYLLQREKIEWFFNNYFEKGVDREQASPLYMELDGRIPESLVITAEFCPLRDEALTYVRSCKLVDSGLKTSILKIWFMPSSIWRTWWR